MPKRTKLIATVTVGEQTYEIDVLDLRSRERIALEEFLEKPMMRIQAEGWITSEKALSFIGYLAKARKAPTFTYEEFLDLSDDGKATIALNVEEEGKRDRPTRTRRTSGKPKSASSSGSSRGK